MASIADVDIERLITLLKTHNLQEISLQKGDQKICVTAQAHPLLAQPVVATANTTATTTPKQSTRPTIKAPTIGTLYRAPSPTQPAFVQIGDQVKAGQTVCLLEAMKTFNHIKSPIDGTIVEICAENAQIVEFGQILFVLKPEN